MIDQDSAISPLIKPIIWWYKTVEFTRICAVPYGSRLNFFFRWLAILTL